MKTNHLLRKNECAKPMRVLVLTFGFPSFSGKGNSGFLGGSFLVPEALAYLEAGAKVTILTMHVPGTPLKELVKENFEIIRVPYFYPLQLQNIRIPNYPLYTKKKLLWRLFQLPFFIFSYVIHLLKVVPKCDVIHANWTPTAFLVLPFSKIFKRPIFLTYRGSDIMLLPKLFNKLVIKSVDSVFDVKLGDVIKYRKFFKGNFANLPFITNIRYVKTPKASEEDIDEVIFTFIGRLTKDKVQLLKGLDVIIDAISKLIMDFKQRNKFQVQFIGDGPYKKELQSAVTKLKYDKFVFFHGHQKDVFPFIDNSAAVLGGIGLNAVVQETAFSNRLLIMIEGSEWVGDIWKDRKNALLYESQNSDSLASVMNYVISNPKNCRKIAVEGNKTIKKYATTISEGGKIYLKHFEDLIKKRE